MIQGPGCTHEILNLVQPAKTLRSSDLQVPKLRGQDLDMCMYLGVDVILPFKFFNLNTREECNMLQSTDFLELGILGTLQKPPFETVPCSAQ